MEYKEHNAISIHTQSEHIGHSGTEDRSHSRTEYTGHFRYRTYSSLLVQNILVNPGTENYFNPHNKSWTSHGHILRLQFPYQTVYSPLDSLGFQSQCTPWQQTAPQVLLPVWNTSLVLLKPLDVEHHGTFGRNFVHR